MRKRRVGVTARSRQIVESQVTGSRQIASEMAAPLELRTPMGSAAKAAIRVQMEVWRQWRGSQLAEGNPMGTGRRQSKGNPVASRVSSALRAHEALPQTSPGGKPPETPGPLSLLPHYSDPSESVKGSQAAQKPRALDRLPRLGRPTVMRERGPLGGRCILPPAGRPGALNIMQI